jgi:hypothetical protein
MQKPDESELTNIQKFLLLTGVFIVMVTVIGVIAFINEDSEPTSYACDANWNPASYADCPDPNQAVEAEADEVLNKYPDVVPEYDYQGDCGGLDCKQVEAEIQQELSQ